MNKTRIITAMALGMTLAPQALTARDLTITVTNNEDVQRQEVVEIDAAKVSASLELSDSDKLTVKNALGQQVAYQLTHDGKLLIDVAVRPKGSAKFTVSKGTPAPMKHFVKGKQYPERVDDIAWENDRTAYRIYGPALQASGERAFGVDVWLKNTPDLEVDKRYATELSNHPAIQKLREEGKDDEALAMEQATTYHYDHGYGLDCYKVGPTLGCGAPALLDANGQLILPYCYKSFEILDNGPLRFTVHVTYNPAVIGNDDNVVEHRIISLDKGSNYNKVTVWYEGLTANTKLAAGVVLHQEDLESIEAEDDMVLYADPTDNPAGQNFQIYVGVLFPEGVESTTELMNEKIENGNAGHLVGITTYKPGQKYTYYFGSAWSKNDVRTFKEWELRSEETLEALQKPLKVNIQ